MSDLIERKLLRRKLFNQTDDPNLIEKEIELEKEISDKNGNNGSRIQQGECLIPCQPCLPCHYCSIL